MSSWKAGLRRRIRKSSVLAIVLPAPLWLGGCGASEPSLDPALAEGKAIWEATCKVCHLNGIAGAPKMGDMAAWADRIAQGQAVLVDHATQGFKGKEGEMPARGGNDSLTDEQVANAVAYMVSMSQ